MPNTKKVTVDQLSTVANAIAAKSDARFLKLADGYTKVEIDGKLSGAYKAAGSKSAAELTAALLTAANQGKVFNLADALTVTDENKALFAENVSGSYPAGTNAVVVEGAAAHYAASEDDSALEGKTYFTRSGEEGSYTYAPVESLEAGTDISGESYFEFVDTAYVFDVLAGFVDLSGYATTADVETASAQDIQGIVDGIWA